MRHRFEESLGFSGLITIINYIGRHSIFTEKQANFLSTVLGCVALLGDGVNINNVALLLFTNIMIDKFLDHDHELKSIIQSATTGGFIALGCDSANTIKGLKELLKGSAGGLATSLFARHLLIKANDEDERRARHNNPR